MISHIYLINMINHIWQTMTESANLKKTLYKIKFIFIILVTQMASMLPKLVFQIVSMLPKLLFQTVSMIQKLSLKWCQWPIGKNWNHLKDNFWSIETFWKKILEHWHRLKDNFWKQWNHLSAKYYELLKIFFLIQV